MHRFTGLAGIAAAAAVGVAGIGLPAYAEAIVYEDHDVQSNPPKKAGHEYASLDIPTGYARARLDWHTVGFFEQVDQGRAIVMDLHPAANTVKELKAERDQLAENAGDDYTELGFKVNGKDAKVRARWVYSYSEAGTGDVDPLVSVMLMSGNQLRIVGNLADKEQIKVIRDHVVDSVTFPS